MNDSSEEKRLEDLLVFYLKKIRVELMKDRSFKEYLNDQRILDERQQKIKNEKELLKKNIENYIDINKYLTINKLLKE